MTTAVLPRQRVVRAAAPGGSRGAARRPRPGVRRPAAAARPGRDARLLLDNAREAVAEALGVRPDEVTFTPSGTDAVHLGLLGLLRAAARGRRVVALGGRALGRPARASPGGRARRPSTRARRRHGRVDLARTLGAPRRRRRRAADRQPRGRHASSPSASSQLPDDVPLFMDACASMGRLPLPDGWAAAAGSAHKWGGPAGVGVLLVRKGARWRNPFPADDRVDERATGFENVPAVLGRRRRAPGRGGRARRGQRAPARAGRPDPARRWPRCPTSRWSATRSTGSPTW